MSASSKVSDAGLHPWLEWIWQLGFFVKFSVESCVWFFFKPFRFKLLLDEIEFVGNQSIFIVSLTGMFTGSAFAYQSWLGYSMVGLDSMVGPTVALSLIRELGPVLTAIAVAGRAGSAMAAKIGIMRVTEQIDALEVMAISPQQYLVGPRILGSLIATPLLVAVFGLVGNIGGWFVSSVVCGVDSGIYIEKVKLYVDPWDFYHGIIKGLFFGVMIAAIGCYKGYYAKNGAEGVGRATNESVVNSIVVIIMSNYFLGILIPTGIRTQ